MSSFSLKVNSLVDLGILVIRVVIIVLLINGAIQLSQSVFKTSAFDEYPIDNYNSLRFSPNPDVSTEPKLSQNEIDKQDNITRKLAQLNDYSSAIGMLLVSGGLFWLVAKYSNYSAEKE